MIDIIAKSIHFDILSGVKKAKFYLLIADEVANVGNKEQLSLSLCYILDDEVNEVFIDFVEVERMTGRELVNGILQSLVVCGLSSLDMQGQC